MAYTLVQEAHEFSFTTSAQPTITPSNNVTKGNLLIAWCASFNATYQIVNEGCNTWIPIKNYQGVSGTEYISAWYCIVKRTGPVSVQFFDMSTTVEFFPGGAPTNLQDVICQVLEFSGNSMNPLDASAFGTGSSGVASESVSSSVANELIWGCGITSTTATTSPGAGWLDPSGTGSITSVYNLESASGAYSPTFNLTASAPWGVIAAAFKPAGTKYMIFGSATPGASVSFLSQTTNIFYSTTCEPSSSTPRIGTRGSNGRSQT